MCIVKKKKKIKLAFKGYFVTFDESEKTLEIIQNMFPK